MNYKLSFVVNNGGLMTGSRRVNRNVVLINKDTKETFLIGKHQDGRRTAP